MLTVQVLSHFVPRSGVTGSPAVSINSSHVSHPDGETVMYSRSKIVQNQWILRTSCSLSFTTIQRFCGRTSRRPLHVRPYPLTSYVHRPFERTSIQSHVVRPYNPMSYDHKNPMKMTDEKATISIKIHADFPYQYIFYCR